MPMRRESDSELLAILQFDLGKRRGARNLHSETVDESNVEFQAGPVTHEMCQEAGRTFAAILESLIEKSKVEQCNYEKELAIHEARQAQEEVQKLNIELDKVADLYSACKTSAEAQVTSSVLSELASSLAHHMYGVEAVCAAVASKLPNLLNAERCILYIVDGTQELLWSVLPGPKRDNAGQGSEFGKRIVVPISGLVQQAINFAKIVRETALIQKGMEDSFQDFDGEYRFRNLQSSDQDSCTQGEVIVIPIIGQSGDVVAALQLMSKLTDVSQASLAAAPQRSGPDSKGQDRLTESVLTSTSAILSLALICAGLVQDCSGHKHNSGRDLAQKLMRSESYTHIMTHLVGDVQPSDLFLVLHNSAASLFSAERVQLYLMDKTSGRLWFRSMDGGRRELRIDDGTLPAQAIASRRAVNTSTDPATSPASATHSLQRTARRVPVDIEPLSSSGIAYSILCCPVISTEGEVLGAIEVFRPKTQRFDHSDEQAAERLCTVTARALHHLYRAERDRSQLADLRISYQELQDRRQGMVKKELQDATSNFNRDMRVLKDENESLRNDIVKERKQREDVSVRMREDAIKCIEEERRGKHMEIQSMITSKGQEIKELASKYDQHLLAKDKEMEDKEAELASLKAHLLWKLSEAKKKEKELTSSATQACHQRDEAVTKLLQYRQHVKRTRRSAEQSLQEEKTRSKIDAHQLRDLERKLEEIQQQLSMLQQTYHNSTLATQVERSNVSMLNQELDSLRQENNRLRDHEAQLHARLRRLASMERK